MGVANMVLERVEEIKYRERNGYTLPEHELYPRAYTKPFNFPYDTSRKYLPALNILTQESFDKLRHEHIEAYEYDPVREIGTLDFYDEIVAFFGSFYWDDILYTKLTPEELESYGLPECFIKHSKRIYEKNKKSNGYYYWDDLNNGFRFSTVIVVLGDSEIKLYHRK